MARTRSIKPAFFDNDILGGLSPLTRLLFIGLWCQADRDGRLEDRPGRIKKTVLGYDDLTVEDVDKMLEALATNGFIVRYAAAGEQYIQVVHFRKHQNPHMKERASEIPPPPGLDDGVPIAEPQPEEAPKEPTGQKEQDEEKPASANGGPAEPQGEPAEELGADGEKPPQEPEMSAVERRFELFWAAYPKKVAKKEALKAFKKAKPNEELFTKIMEAIAKAKTSRQWQRDHGDYIPNPATWLNQGRWDDEQPEEETRNGTPGRHPPRSDAGRGSPPPTGKGAITGFKPAD